MLGKVISALAAIGGVLYYRRVAARNEAERKKRFAAGREAAIERKLRVRELRQAISNGVAADMLIIDSNIWMNEHYDAFFALLTHLLQANNQRLLLVGSQFDEICNMKSACPIGDEKGRRARLALTRIEELQSSNLLRIDSMGLTSKRNAYADPLFLQLVEHCGKKRLRIAMITDDRELRVRAREVASRYSGDLTLLSVIECKTDSRLFREAIGVSSEEAS